MRNLTGNYFFIYGTQLITFRFLACPLGLARIYIAGQYVDSVENCSSEIDRGGTGCDVEAARLS